MAAASLRPLSSLAVLFGSPAIGAGLGAGLLARGFVGRVGPILEGIWDSILRAVPKKKTTYSKKRSRFLAGKALKDETAIKRCSTCGQPIRLHIICPYCLEMVRYFWKRTTKEV